MKKLLFFLSFLIFYSASYAQPNTKVVLKGGNIGIANLLPIAPNTIVANATGGIATPTAVPIGYGLIFQGGKLAVDTTIKDTVFAANGLQWIGPGTRTIGLGGFLAQNTTISGSNNWDFTLDSMQAKVGSGFRINFGNDLPYDMYYRDSATNHMKNFGKGAVGQVLTMLGTGGIGWATFAGGGALNLTTTGTSGAATLVGTTLNIPVYAAGVSTVGAFSGSSIANGASISGTTITFGPADGTNPGMVKPSGVQTFGPTITFTNAPILTTSSTVGYVWTATGTGGQGGWSPATGGGSSLTRQNITSGSSGSVTVPNTLVKFNPSSALTSYALTLPTGATDLQTVEVEFGGTLSSGTVITSFSVIANSGWTIQDNTPPTSAAVDNYLKYVADATLHIWYRRKY